MSLSPQQPAPDFEVADHKGKTHRLGDYRGKTLVLWFFPRASTPGCTAEGCSFRDLAAEFAQKKAAIVGVSVDDAAANARFAEKERFNFPLLCDTSRAMCIAYGACDDAQASSARRAGVVVGPDGKIVSYAAKVDAKGWPAQVLATL